MTVLTDFRPQVQSALPDDTCRVCRTHTPGRSVPRARTLSELDAAILQTLASGASSVQIAAQLHLSRQAVDYHIHGMLRFLKAGNRPGLISKAYSLGILMVGHWPPKVTPECAGSSGEGAGTETIRAGPEP